MVALRYRVTEQCNLHLASFWDSFPVVEGDAKSDVPAVPLHALLPPALLAGGYYSWDGSLTTPPCTEGVRWFLLKQEETVCEVSPTPHPPPRPPRQPRPPRHRLLSPASASSRVPVQAQVQRLRATLRDIQGVDYNSRATQPLNNRTVFELEFDSQP